MTINRIDHAGAGTFDRLSPVIDVLLRARRYAPVLMTVDPSAVPSYTRRASNTSMSAGFDTSSAP